MAALQMSSSIACCVGKPTVATVIRYLNVYKAVAVIERDFKSFKATENRLLFELILHSDGLTEVVFCASVGQESKGRQQILLCVSDELYWCLFNLNLSANVLVYVHRSKCKVSVTSVV